MRTKSRVAVIAGGLLVMLAAVPVGSPAWLPRWGALVEGHHAFSSEFDAAKPVKLSGVVKKMEWINPHSWLTLEVKRADGIVETWEIEAGAPNAMFRRGFNKNSLPVGTLVVVNGFQAKDGRKRANGRDIAFPDGKKLFIGSSGTGAPADGRDKP